MIFVIIVLIVWLLKWNDSGLLAQNSQAELLVNLMADGSAVFRLRINITGTA